MRYYPSIGAAGGGELWHDDVWGDELKLVCGVALPREEEEEERSSVRLPKRRWLLLLHAAGDT